MIATSSHRFELAPSLAFDADELETDGRVPDHATRRLDAFNPGNIK